MTSSRSLLVTFAVLIMTGATAAQTLLPAALPTITLQAPGGPSRMVVAYHPVLDRYYAWQGGTSACVFQAFDSGGTELQQLLINVDPRGGFFNPNTGDLEVVTNSASNCADTRCGLVQIELDATDFYTGNITQLAINLTGLGPSSQATPAYEPAADLLYARSGMSDVMVAERLSGQQVGAITPDFAAAGFPVVAPYAIGYTGVPGYELVIVSNSTDDAKIFDLNGAFAGAVPMGFDVNTEFSANWANGQLWIFDGIGGANVWRGFQIFTPPACVTGASPWVRAVDSAPTVVQPGQLGVPVSVTVENLGPAAVGMAAVTLRFTGTADRTAEYVVTPDPGNPTSIPGFATALFAFTVDADPGATQELIRIEAAVTGIDPVCGGVVADDEAEATDLWRVLDCGAPGTSILLEIALPTLTLPATTSSSKMSVAYHPAFDRYYGCQGASPFLPFDVYDGMGNPVAQTGIGLDPRSLYYNPNTGNLEMITHDAYSGVQPANGLFSIGLDPAGVPDGSFVQIHSPLPGLAPTSQTSPAYAPSTNRLYSRNFSDTVYVADRFGGIAIGTVDLDLDAAYYPNLARLSIGYTEVPGYELAVASYHPDAVYLFDLAGTFQGVVQLPVAVYGQNDFTGNWANGQFWVFEGPSMSWRGFEIFQSACTAAIDLEVRTVDAPATMTSPGATALPVMVTVENLGPETATGLTVALSFSDGIDRTAEYVVTPDPGNPTAIAAAATVAFDFLVDVLPSATTGTIVIDASATASDSACCADADPGADVTDAWDVVSCPATRCGDCFIDGVLNILDALQAARFAAGLDTPPPFGSPWFNDCNAAGLRWPNPGAVIDTVDLLVLAQASAGILTLVCC